MKILTLMEQDTKISRSTLPIIIESKFDMDVTEDDNQIIDKNEIMIIRTRRQQMMLNNIDMFVEECDNR